MVVADAGLLENRRAPATTLEGWRAFISADPSELALLTRRRWEGLGERDRRDYDDARIAHHAELVVVTTSAITEITSEGQLLVLMNQREIGARRGLIVSGDAATGKTTAIKQLGRLHELRIRARFPAGDGRIPVVYVTCPPKGSPRKLAMEFARFLGLPLRTRANVTDIANAVCQVLIDARTDLVLVDEIHNLNHGTPAGEDLSDHLKYFTEHLPATFIYAGIDVERCGVFTGTRGRQLAGRCELICTGPFPYRDECGAPRVWWETRFSPDALVWVAVVFHGTAAWRNHGLIIFPLLFYRTSVQLRCPDARLIWRGFARPGTAGAGVSPRRAPAVRRGFPGWGKGDAQRHRPRRRRRP